VILKLSELRVVAFTKFAKESQNIFVTLRILTADMGRLQHKCNRLRLLATCSITITNKQNHNVIDYDYIESNHDYYRDYFCLQTSSERKHNTKA